MGMAGQGRPVAAAPGRSLSCDYRVCEGRGSGDNRDAKVSVCMFLWVLTTGCVHAWQRKIAGTAMLKKQPKGKIQG